MLDWGFGLGAFGMFFLYDWNRVFLKKNGFAPLFAAGNLLLAVVGGRMVYSCVSSGVKGQPVWLLPGAFFLAMLIYTLYFALPFDSTYCQEADRHKVCRSGMYGWCRHPGIWWFFGCFLYGPVHRESGPGDARSVPFFFEPSVCLVSGQAYICRGILRLQGLPGTSTIFTTQTVEKAVNWNDI